MARKKKKKKKTVTIVSLVLDETGSMLSRLYQTLSGVNEYMLGLKQQKGKIVVTITLFNSNKTRVLFDGVNIHAIPEITARDYKPRSLTPLYDAIATAIHAVDTRLKTVQGDPGVLFVIVTDGQENASMEYTQEGVFSMIDKRKTKGWTFAFLGADQDAFSASADLGIPKGNTVSFQGEKMEGTMAVMSEATTRYMNSGSVVTASLFEEVDTSDIEYKAEESKIVLDEDSD
jgi:Mg-chelatase subunit ChlD